jgi:hypothetical protein
MAFKKRNIKLTDADLPKSQEVRDELETLKEKYPVPDGAVFDRKAFLTLLSKRAGFSLDDTIILFHALETLLLDILLADATVFIPRIFEVQVNTIKGKYIPNGPSTGYYPELRSAHIRFTQYVRDLVSEKWNKNGINGAVRIPPELEGTNTKED